MDCSMPFVVSMTVLGVLLLGMYVFHLDPLGGIPAFGVTGFSGAPRMAFDYRFSW